jgi:CRP/FNR family transcriptional regulator, cyclic AMP receptor protein
MALDGRHHTGLRVNEALATAAMAGGGGSLGLSISTARLTFHPFVRGQVGRMQRGDQRFGISGLAGGMTIGSRMYVQTTDFLGTVSLFRGLDRSELDSFAAVTRERSYPRGSVIVFEDDPGDALFIVREGRVKVVLIGEDGREVILGILGVGDHFGELSLIDGRPRSAHVIAMEEARLLVLRREDFRQRVQESPRVGWALMQELSARLRKADEQIGSLVLLDVNGRIAQLLLARFGSDAAAVRGARLTHQQIAQMVGASRETVSRAMKEFQDHGWISVERRQIVVTDRAALEKLSHGRG